MMRRALLWVFTCALLVCAVAASLSAENLKATAGPNIIILGAPISQSGRYAENGRSVHDGYSFAISTINAKGGVEIDGKSYKLALKFYDDRSMPAESAAITERLIRNDGVKFLLGPYSTELTEAAQPVAETYDVPMVDANGAGSSLFQRGYRYIFAVLSPTDRYFTQLFALADQDSPRLGKTAEQITVAIASHSDAFSQDLRDAVLGCVARHHMRLVLDDQMSDFTSDLRMTLDRINLLKPDILVISGHDEAAVAALRQVKAAHLQVPILAVSHCDSAKITKKVPDAAEHVFCPMQWDRRAPYQDSLFGTAAAFADNFEKRFGYEPPFQAAQSAAAIEVYADALARAGSLDPKRVRNALAQTDLTTFYGPIKFDATGRNTVKPMMLTQVIGGKYVLIAPGQLAQRQPIIGEADKP